MINPEKRKDLIIMLKLLQNEDAFEKIYDYVRKILSEPEEETTTVSEPVAKYETKYTSIFPNTTEEYAQEILDNYNESGGGWRLSEEQWEEVLEAHEEAEKYPERLIPFEDVLTRLEEKWLKR